MLLALGAIAARVPRPVAIPTSTCASPSRAEPDRWVRAWWALAAALALVPGPARRDLGRRARARHRRRARLAGRDRRPPLGPAASPGSASLWARLPVGPVLASRVAARGVSVRRAGPAARGAALAAVLLSVFVPLLMSADAAFAQLLEDVVPTGWSVDRPGRPRSLVLALVIAAGGALLHARLRPPNPSPRPRGLRASARSRRRSRSARSSPCSPRSSRSSSRRCSAATGTCSTPPG